MHKTMHTKISRSYKFFLLTILIILMSNFYASSEDVPHKILFVNPYILNSSDYIETYIINEISGLMDKLAVSKDIDFIKKRVWERFAYLLTDPNNLKNMSEFHVKTGATGVILIKIDQLLKEYSIEITFYSYYDSSVSTILYRINKFEPVNGVNEMLINLETLLREKYPKISKEDMAELKNYAKHVYHEYEKFAFRISIGSGYLMKGSYNSSNISVSPIASLNIGLKFYNFDIESQTYYAPGILITPFNGRVYNNTVRTRLMLGGWFLYDIFRFSLGFGFEYTENFYRKYLGQFPTVDGGWEPKFEYGFSDYIFFGGNFGLTFKPFKSFRLDLVYGIGFNSVEFAGLLSQYYSVYVRYYILTNFFAVIGLEFAMINEMSSNSNNSEYGDNRVNISSNLLEFSFGWHIGRGMK